MFLYFLLFFKTWNSVGIQTMTLLGATTSG